MMQKQVSERRFLWTVVTILGVVVVLNYLPVLSGRIPFPRDLVVRHSAWNGKPRDQLPQLIDIAAMFYPFRALLSRAAGEGTIPLWNPYALSGAPFQANAQSAVFAPLNTFYYIMPPVAAWTIILAIRLFLAAFFMTLFVRSVGGSFLGSVFAGITFGLCGFTTEWQGMSNGDSGIWLPLMCYAVHRLHQDRRLSGASIAIAGFAFAMPVLSGHPETAAHSTVAAAAIALFLWSRPLRPDAPKFERRFATGFILSAVLAVGIAAVQIIPTVEWMGQLGLGVEVEQPVLDRHQGQGFFSRDLQSDPNSAGIAVPEGAAYIGMLALLAATLALFHRNRGYVLFLAGLAALSIVVAFGLQPIRWLVVHLPLIKAMKNGRLILVADFTLAAMAGLGLTVLGENMASIAAALRRRASIILTLVLIVGGIAIYRMHLATLSPVPALKSPLSSFIFLLAGFAVLIARLRGILKDRQFAVLVCGIAAFEMLTYSFGYLGFAAPREVFPTAPVIDFIRSRPDAAPFRVAKDRVPIPHDAGMVYGFEAADGYDLTTERTRRFTADLTEQREDGVMFLAEKMIAARDRRLDMLNVKYVMVTAPGEQFDLMTQQNDRFTRVFQQPGVAVFENRTVLPRFFSVPVSRIEVVPSISGQLDRLKEATFSPERSVIFSELPVVGGNPEDSRTETRVEILERGNNGYRIRTDSTGPAVVVVSQMYYPGWKASVDGLPTPVFPVDMALTGFIVPSGVHEVRLFFRPNSFLIGLAISILSLAIAAVCLRR
jgi:hypothetical protein